MSAPARPDLDALVLLKGAHDRRDDGVCFMEAVAWFAGEKHSDSPKCVSPVIGNFMRRWNDDLDDAGRQLLKPYVEKVIGTVATREVEDARGWMLADWMFRTHLPTWLELAGIVDPAAALRALPPVASQAALSAALPEIRIAGQRAAAARAAARAAAWAAARAAAWDAAWAAARDAAWAAAWDAAWAAARAAAWDAAWAAAWAAADGARAAGGDYSQQYAAAYKVVAEKLQPTRASLQQSAFELLDRMLAAGAKVA